MNSITLYPGLKNKDVYAVLAYGFWDVWSVEDDSIIGGIEEGPGAYQRAKAMAIQAGWNWLK